jgi:hypothetical protein
MKFGVWCAVNARRIVRPVLFNEKINCKRYVQTVCLVSARFSYCPHRTFLCDFFVLACLKDKVYSSNPRTEELKENVRREIANIPAEQLQRINQNLFRRGEECVHVEGQHFQHIL